MLRPFGILELVQTGTVAMTRGVEKHDLAHPHSACLPDLSSVTPF